MRWTIRPTLPADRQDVLKLVKEAVTGEGHDGRPRDGHEEMEIVHRTWELGVAPAELDLVAVQEDGLVIGHVLAPPGALVGSKVPVGQHVLAVAPLAVRPSQQGEGVGSSLMREVLRQTERSGAPVILLLGDPAYYRRFGFEPASLYGICHPPLAIDDPHFMARRFTDLGKGWRGAFYNCWEDGPASSA